MLAHRAAFLREYGYLPDKGRHLHHLCSVRSCVRGDHLRDVSVKEHRNLHPGPRYRKPRDPRKRKLKWADHKQVVSLYEKGHGEKEIAKEVKLPVERVLKILGAHGYSSGGGMTAKNQLVKEILTDREAAELLGVTPEQVKKMAREGEIPGRKIGQGKTSPWRFSRRQIIGYVEGEMN